MRGEVAVLPNFLIIGAAKSGTSALYDALVRHPQVFGSPIKEPNFFALGGQHASFRGPGDDDTVNRLSVSDRSEYERLFEAARGHVAVGEASTMYLSSERAPEAIRTLVPDMRLICVLREPVARAFSSYLHMVRDGREPLSSFAAALADEDRRIADNWEPLWHYSRLSEYHTHLSRYFDVFPRRQIHLVLYEESRANAHDVLTSILDFLDLDPEVSLDHDRRVNVSGEPRSRFIQQLLVRESAAKRLFRRVVPQRLRHVLWNQLANLNVTARRRRLDPREARRLATRLESDVDALEDLWGRDLSVWKEAWAPAGASEARNADGHDDTLSG